MPDPSHLRDSTQIELPTETLDDFRDRLEAEFTVTILQDESAQCRIVGSPVEIKAVSGFLSRHGVALR
jgi:hypothetical protein